MSDVKREIQFFDSMTFDKRLDGFAYLRKNCFRSGTKGLYPSHDFENIGLAVPAGYKVVYMDADSTSADGSTSDGLIVIEDIFNDIVKFYKTRTGDLVTTVNSAIFHGAARDDDYFLHAVLEVSGTEKLYMGSGSGMGDQGSISATGANTIFGKFDGLNLYWTEPSTGSKIYRSAPQSTTFTEVFTNVGLNPIDFDFYGNQMVLFGEDTYGKDTYILFWDKSNTTLFSKRIIEKNSRFLAGGVVDGRLLLVKLVGNSTNKKEHSGKLVVAAYDGEKFVEINSIKIEGSSTVRTRSKANQAIGNGVMVFCVTSNQDDRDDLYKNWLFKVYADGSIETMWASDDVSPMIPAVGYDEILFVESNLDFSGTYQDLTQVIRSNKDDSTAYADTEAFTTTEYITNFLNNPYNFHKLDSFTVAFEKLFEQTDAGASPATGEELDVYFRVSSRDDWTQLMNVTVEKVKDNVNVNRDQSTEYASDTLGLPEQRYTVTILPDESPLPEFNEIQFKFVSKRGFSLIGAWYGYSYLSRNTLE